MSAAPKWPSEAAMMAVFQAEAKAAGFGVYPECCGVDLVLEVTPALMRWLEAPTPIGATDGPAWYAGRHHPFAQLRGDVEVGDLIGIEAKLRPTFEVLAQAMPQGRRHGAWETEETRAFDFYAVVVPTAAEGFESVAHACGVWVLYCEPERPEGPGWRASVRLPAGVTRASGASGALRVHGYQRHVLPRVQVEMVAGAAAPRRVTTWKIDAVELCLIAAARPLVRADFRCRRVQPSSMVRSGWLQCEGRGSAARWRLADGSADRITAYGRRPDLAYPEIVTAVLAAGFDPAGSGAPVASGQRSSGAA